MSTRRTHRSASTTPGGGRAGPSARGRLRQRCGRPGCRHPRADLRRRHGAVDVAPPPRIRGIGATSTAPCRPRRSARGRRHPGRPRRRRRPRRAPEPARPPRGVALALRWVRRRCSRTSFLRRGAARLTMSRAVRVALPSGQSGQDLPHMALNLSTTSGTSGKYSVQLGRLSLFRIQFGGAKPGTTRHPRPCGRWRRPRRT